MCRFINAYGPQEYEDLQVITEFYARLDQEIQTAKMLGFLVFIEMDANAKLGTEFIQNDPHDISANGTVLRSIILRNNLVVCNGTSLCNGLITRERTVANKKQEQSIIDFAIVCQDLFLYMDSMTIDDNN